MSSTGLPSSFEGDADFYEESRWQKFSRLIRQEPLIPFGTALTCWAFFGASRSIRRGDSVTANRMFRARIYAQGFTIVAMVVGSVYWKSDRQKRKQFEGLVAERKAREKNEAWIRELEARDEEAKEIAAQKEALREQKRRIANAAIIQQGGMEEALPKEADKDASMPKCMVEKKEERLGIFDAVQDILRTSTR